MGKQLYVVYTAHNPKDLSAKDRELCFHHAVKSTAKGDTVTTTIVDSNYNYGAGSLCDECHEEAERHLGLLRRKP